VSGGEDDDGAPGGLLVPMADILTGTTAVLAAAILVLRPSLVLPEAPPPAPPPGPPEPVTLTGEAVAGLAAAGEVAALATAAGVEVAEAGAARFVALDDIGQSLAVDSLVRAAGEGPLVLVAADGQEAAFVLEARLASLGLGSVRRARLPQDCGAVVAAADDGVVCRARDGS